MGALSELNVQTLMRRHLTATLTATAVSLRRTGWSPCTSTPRGMDTDDPKALGGRRPLRLLILVSWVRIPAGSPPFHAQNGRFRGCQKPAEGGLTATLTATANT